MNPNSKFEMTSGYNLNFHEHSKNLLAPLKKYAIEKLFILILQSGQSFPSSFFLDIVNYVLARVFFQKFEALSVVIIYQPFAHQVRVRFLNINLIFHCFPDNAIASPLSVVF